MKILILLLFIIFPTASVAQNMDERCDGNFSEACYVYIEGRIEANAGEKLLNLKISDASRVVLNSPGGDLLGGIFLGSMIRKLGLTTEVGRSSKKDTDIFSSISHSEGSCHSACAYAFLGGVERDSNSISRIGFHRFYNPIDFMDISLGQAGQIRYLASEDAQRISAILVMYIIEMGVDARMLVKYQNHGPESIYTFSSEDGLMYGIITNRRFGPWFIEPYGKSIVAATRKTGISTAYDQVHQITTYCRNNSGKRQPYILLSIPLQDYSNPEYMSRVGASLYFGPVGNEREIQIEPSHITSWRDAKFMQIELALGSEAEYILTHADRFGLSMNTGRSLGLYYYDGQTSTKEKSLVKASFLHCR